LQNVGYKSRPKRDTWANFPAYAELSSTKSKGGFSPTVKPTLQIITNDNQKASLTSSAVSGSPLAFNVNKFFKAMPPSGKPIVVNGDSVKVTDKHQDLSIPIKSKSSGRSLFNPSPMMEKVEMPTILDFGEYSDNEEADREDSKSALSEKHVKRINFTDDGVSIVKSHDILSDYPTHHEYIPTVRRPNRKLSDSNKNKFASRKSPSSSLETPDNNKKQFSLQSPITSFSKQSPVSGSRRPSNYFDFTSSSKADLKNRQNYSFSNEQGSKDGYDDLFGEQQPEKDTKERYFGKNSEFNFGNLPNYQFDKASSFDFSKSDKSPRFHDEKSFHHDFDKSPKYEYDESFESNSRKSEKENKQQHSDYDNIEYFEPVIIDIDSGEQFSDLFSKFRPKLKSKITPATETKHINEPLKLPNSLHETVDFIKTKNAHPPAFDLLSEADEHKVAVMIEENEVR